MFYVEKFEDPALLAVATTVKLLTGSLTQQEQKESALTNRANLSVKIVALSLNDHYLSSNAEFQLQEPISHLSEGTFSSVGI